MPKGADLHNHLAGSNADAFVAQISSGTMAFSFGLDGPNATTPFAVSYDGNLGAASSSSAAGVTTFTSASWTLTINQTTGAYSFTQTAAYQHDSGATTDSGIITITLKDADGSTVEHNVAFFRLVGGGMMGDMGKPLSASRLAILPATSHTAVITQVDLLHPIIEQFLKGETPKGFFGGN